MPSPRVMASVLDPRKNLFKNGPADIDEEQEDNPAEQE